MSGRVGARGATGPVLAAGVVWTALVVVGPAPHADAAPETVEVDLRFAGDRDPGTAVASVVDELADPAVLSLRVAGFDEYDVATAVQCRATADGHDCGDAIPVQFDRWGSAAFQFAIVGHVPDRAGGGCRASDPPCVVVITSNDRQRRVEVGTVFHDRLPAPATMSVEPAGPLRPGQVVSVSITGAPPGSTGTVTTCTGWITDPGRCGAPAPVAAVLVGPDGNGQAQVAVTRGPVGVRRDRCADEDPCVLAVIAGRADLRVAPVPVRIAAAPGAEYDPVRLGVGLAIAASLLLVAATLVRRTDWSVVGGAATPELDEAAYADLDAIVAALPPEEPSPTRDG